MAANVGSQTVLIKYYDRVQSWRVNNRFKDIRPRGIYKGGYARVVSGKVRVYPLVCEIGDDDYQVKVETTEAVDVTISDINHKYVILRWAYTGDKDADYMELLAVEEANVGSNDLVVCVVTFTGGGAVENVVYYDSSFYRSTPNVQDITLRVEADQRPGVSTGVIVRSGWVHAGAEAFHVPEQFVELSSYAGSKIIYVDLPSGSICIDSTSLNYNGKLILAEVSTLGAANVSATDITDVRGFITPHSTSTSQFAYGWGETKQGDVTVTLDFSPRYVRAWNNRNERPAAFWCSRFEVGGTGGEAGDAANKGENGNILKEGNPSQQSKLQFEVNEGAKTIRFIAKRGKVNCDTANYKFYFVAFGGGTDLGELTA